MFDGILGGINDSHILYGRDAMFLVGDMTDSGSVVNTCQHPVEINQRMLRIRVVRYGFTFNQVCPSDNVIHPGKSHFRQMFTDFLRQEREEIH